MLNLIYKAATENLISEYIFEKETQMKLVFICLCWGSFKDTVSLTPYKSYVIILVSISQLVNCKDFVVNKFPQ